MAVYNQNIEALLKRFPEYRKQVKTEKADPNIQSENVGEKQVFYINTEAGILLLDSLYEMGPVLDLWRENISTSALYTKFFIFGLGNGMMARKLLETTDVSNQVFVYEPDFGILQYIFQYVDMSDLFKNERFHLIVGNALSDSLGETLAKYLVYTDIATFQCFVYPNYNYYKTEEYLLYVSAMEKTIMAINGTQAVIGRFNEAFFRNTFENIPYLCESKSFANLYTRIQEGLPAIVVASGPSLDKNVKDLLRAKNKALIVAADSSLRTLLNAGVIPDLCVSVDPKKLTKHFSNDIANDIPIVCQLSSNCDILKTHRASKFFVNDLNQHVQNFFTEKEILFPVISSGGSVANDAFAICQMLGFKTIIMVGQDLAYTNNKTHSAMSVRGEWNIDVSTLENNTMTEDIYGQPILSSHEFTLYRDWIEEQIETHPDLLAVDATEGGAKIKGSEIMTLSEAIDKYCNKAYDYEKAISETDRFMSEEVASEFIEYIKNIPDELEACKKQVKEGINLYEQMLKLIYSDKYHSQSMKRLFEKVQVISDFLDTEPAMEYVKNHIQNETTEFLNNVYVTKNDERADLLDVCNKGVDYLKVELKGIEEIIPMVKEKINY